MAWRIAVALPEERFLALIAKIRFQLGWVYAVALLVFVALAYLIIRSLTEPLRILGLAVTRLKLDLYTDGTPSRQETELIALLSGRRDEMGQLARAFSSFSESLAESLLSLKSSVAEKEVLLKEVHHRVKNNLQIITSLLSLRADEAGNAAASGALHDMRDRVFAMALVHEVIYSSGEFAAVPMDDYVTRLGHSLSAYDRSRDGIELSVHSDRVNLPLERAIPCALAIVELASNSFKYAFAGRERGRVSVSLEAKVGGVQLSVRDDGVGMGSASGTDGTGISIVKALVSQLRGTLEFATGAQGTLATIRFPLP
jgi:two-component sensor histidine kinase